MGEKDLSVLAKNLSGLPLDSITLEKHDVVANATVNANVSVITVKIPVSVALQPSVSNGQLVFTPTSIRAAGQTFTGTQLASNALLGPLATTLLRGQSFCVAQYLPKALTATSAEVRGTTLRVMFSARGATLGGSDFTTKGRCS